MRPIGVVRSQAVERKQMPPLGVPARVEIFPEYAEGLLRLEKHSHIWVLAWLEAAERSVLQVTPRGVREGEPGSLHGVFAVRSPARPNPIGLTAAKITRIEARAIELDRLDFLDGTPVLDIKPYFANRDLIFAAVNAQIGRPAGRIFLRESLLQQALNFHGEFCAGLALGVRVIEHYRAEILGMVDPVEWKVSAPLARACLVDAIMGITRATPGRGSLSFSSADRVEFRQGGPACVYHLLANSAMEPRQVLEASDEELFRLG